MRGQLVCVRRGRARLFFVCVRGARSSCVVRVHVRWLGVWHVRRAAPRGSLGSRASRPRLVTRGPRGASSAGFRTRPRGAGGSGARAPEGHRDAVAFCALAGCDRKGLMRAYLCDFLKYFTRAAATAHRHQTQHGRDRHESCRSRAPRVVKPAELVPYQGRSGRTTVPTSNDTYMRLECASFVGIKSVGSTGISTYAAHANAKPPSELWHDTDLS